jgi:hypothetical protein
MITIESKQGAKFNLCKYSMVEVGYHNPYNVRRDVIATMFKALKAGVDAVVTVPYFIDGTGITTQAIASVARGGSLSIGCQTFSRTATRQLKSWAKQSR